MSNLAVQSSELNDDQPPRYSMLEAAGWPPEEPHVQGIDQLTYSKRSSQFSEY